MGARIHPAAVDAHGSAGHLHGRVGGSRLGRHPALPVAHHPRALRRQRAAHHLRLRQVSPA